MIAIIYVVKWQKRGPPHAHILGICDAENKPRTPEDYDSVVTAEIPNSDEFPELNKTVTSLMMHGPCGLNNPNSPCIVDGRCSKQFPKQFVEQTFAGSDGYPHYRRRDDGKYVLENGVKLDNKYVVPYNPFLSKKYNAHINVEICSSIQSCKYLYKYVYKGPDMASVAVESEVQVPKEKNTDEINKFVNARFVTASEACWQIMSFPVHGRDQSIQRLAVHEENLQMITFDEAEPEDAIKNPKDTTLLAWFKLNQRDQEARKYNYHQIPEHYVWNRHKWTPRKRGHCVGRMYTTNPSQGERHYLRILLHHIPGAVSYNDLRTTPDGRIHMTFKDTAIALGLLESDTEWDKYLAEAAEVFMPQQLCNLFVTILVFGEPARPDFLWETYKTAMEEDLWRKASVLKHTPDEHLKKNVDNEVLLLLQDELEIMGKSLADYNLPIPEKSRMDIHTPHIIQDEMFEPTIQHQISESKCKHLNTDQKNAFEMIKNAVMYENETQRLFFLNAPGGYGKTFLIETILSTVRAHGKIALAVASSGIAAEL